MSLGQTYQIQEKIKNNVHINKLNRLSKGYYKRKTYKSNQVEY